MKKQQWQQKCKKKSLKSSGGSEILEEMFYGLETALGPGPSSTASFGEGQGCVMGGHSNDGSMGAGDGSNGSSDSHHHHYQPPEGFFLDCSFVGGMN